MTCVPACGAGDQRRVDERRDRRLEDRAAPGSGRTSTRRTRARRRRSTSSPPGSGHAAAARRRPRPGTRGGRRATRLTLATVPGVRMLPARQRSDGPSVTGSTRPVSSRFGSMPETIAGAAISSPASSTTPVATPSIDGIATTRAPVRISAPAAWAADGERVGERRRPALREHRLAGGPAVVAGGVGEQHRGRARRPRAHRRVADAAPGERRAHAPGVANDSATKSATAIASTRRIVRPSSLPRPAERAPEPQAQERVAEARRAGSRAAPRRPRSARNRASARTRRSNSTKEVASSADQPRIASTDAARSPHSETARPSGWGANTRTSGETSDRPCFVSASSRATDGRSRPTVWASAGTRTPGASSSVTVAPPIRSRASSDEDAEAAGREIGGGGQAVVAGADDDRVVAAPGVDVSPRQATFRPRDLQELERGEPPVGAHQAAARDAWTSPTATGRGSASGTGRSPGPAG